MTEFYTFDKTLSSVVLFFYLASVYQGVGYGQLIDILQLVAETYASCYGRYPYCGKLLQSV